MNLIADIRAENGTHAKQGHSRACPICAAQDRAWKAFASLNGWKMVERGAPSKYAVDCIGKGFAAASSSWRRQSDYDVGGIFDHVEWFHADRASIASSIPRSMRVLTCSESTRGRPRGLDLPSIDMPNLYEHLMRAAREFALSGRPDHNPNEGCSNHGYKNRYHESVRSNARRQRRIAQT